MRRSTSSRGIAATAAWVLALLLGVAADVGCRRKDVAGRDPGGPTGVNVADPLQATRVYAEALRDGDGPKLRSLHHRGDKEWEAAVDLYVQWVTSSVRLERAATTKFGRGGADQIMSHLLLPTPAQRGLDMLEALDGGGIDPEVTVKGNHASVEIDPVGVIELRRIDGRWGVAMTDGPGGVGAGGQPRAAHAPLLKVLTATQDHGAASIQAGRVRSADDAVMAVERVFPEKARELGLEMDDEPMDEGAE